MWDIILMILKYAGIGIGIILAIVLVLLILLLFVPVRYELDGEKNEKTEAKGSVSWLLRIVNFQASYEGEELKLVLRIFGVPVWRK